LPSAPSISTRQSVFSFLKKNSLPSGRGPDTRQNCFFKLLCQVTLAPHSAKTPRIVFVLFFTFHCNRQYIHTHANYHIYITNMHYILKALTYLLLQVQHPYCGGRDCNWAPRTVVERTAAKGWHDQPPVTRWQDCLNPRTKIAQKRRYYIY
jgi:hypothetical protein